MKNNIKFLFLLLAFFTLNAAKAQSHDNNGCSLNKNFNPAKESYTCKVCIMQIERAKMEKARKDANSAAKEDNRKEKAEKEAAEKAAMEVERKKKEEAEKNKSPKDSTEKIKPVEKPEDKKKPKVIK